MDIFKEDKALFRSGEIKTAFKRALAAFTLVFILDYSGLSLFVKNTLWGLLFLVVLPNIVMLTVYYLSLKSGISKFGLKTYSLRVEYLIIITGFVMIFSVLSLGIMTGGFEFPRMGIIPLITMVLVPFFVKE